MKTIIEVHQEGEFFVATDLVTNVADQGATRKEALANLKKGLEEHYRILMELSGKEGKLAFLEIEVEKFVETPGPSS